MKIDMVEEKSTDECLEAYRMEMFPKTKDSFTLRLITQRTPLNV
jgi:hypothetical protein